MYIYYVHIIFTPAIHLLESLILPASTTMLSRIKWISYARAECKCNGGSWTRRSRMRLYGCVCIFIIYALQCTVIRNGSNIHTQHCCCNWYSCCCWCFCCCCCWQTAKQPNRRKCCEAIKSSREEGCLHFKQLQCNIELNNKRLLTSWFCCCCCWRPAMVAMAIIPMALQLSTLTSGRGNLHKQ